MTNEHPGDGGPTAEEIAAGEAHDAAIAEQAAAENQPASDAPRAEDTSVGEDVEQVDGEQTAPVDDPTKAPF